MRYEKSCGAVVFTRINGEIKYVLVQQGEGFFGFPKGHMEPGETEKETALREIQEEVGLKVRLIDGFRTIDEHLLPTKRNVMKQIIYFLGEYSDQEIFFQKEELLSALLVSFEEAMELFQYESSKRILREADTFLKKELRPVKCGDEKILAYIQTESWKKAFAGILSSEELERYTDIHKAEAMYARVLENPASRGVLLTVDRKPHCLALWGKSRENDMPDYAELICIHSLQENWGRGYGSVVMNHVLDQLQKEGYKKVMLWVFEENTRARKFYEKHGFVLISKTKQFGNAVEVMYCKEWEGT